MSRGPSRLSRPSAGLLFAGVLLVVTALAGCGLGAPNVAVATDTPVPLASLSPAIELTRAQIESALKARGIGLIRPNAPFIPPQDASLVDVPRGVFQAVLGADPGAGYIVVYELPDAAAAATAAQTQAMWIASGPGAVQFTPGTKHVIRVVGNTVVTFSRSPEARDPREADVGAVLESLGQGVPVPTT